MQYDSNNKLRYFMGCFLANCMTIDQIVCFLFVISKIYMLVLLRSKQHC